MLPPRQPTLGPASATSSTRAELELESRPLPRSFSRLGPHAKANPWPYKTHHLRSPPSPNPKHRAQASVLPPHAANPSSQPTLSISSATTLPWTISLPRASRHGKEVAREDPVHSRAFFRVHELAEVAISLPSRLTSAYLTLATQQDPRHPRCIRKLLSNLQGQIASLLVAGRSNTARYR